MATQRRVRFIYGQAAWMLATVLVLTLLHALTLDLLFVISFIGFLVLVELTAPFIIAPTWRRRLKWLIFIGLLIFGVIIVRRILTILPPGVI